MIQNTIHAVMPYLTPFSSEKRLPTSMAIIKVMNMNASIMKFFVFSIYKYSFFLKILSVQSENSDRSDFFSDRLGERF